MGGSSPLPANLLAGSLTGSHTRQIRTEIYFPRALGISALITAIHASPSQPAAGELPPPLWRTQQPGKVCAPSAGSGLA